MKEKALKRIWKEHPFTYALLQNWVFLECDIKIKTANDDFINWLIKGPWANNIELLVKYRKLSSDYKSTKGEGILELTNSGNIILSRALLSLPITFIPEYLITKGDIHKDTCFVKEIIIYRPPKNKTWIQIMQSIREGKLKW